MIKDRQTWLWLAVLLAFGIALYFLESILMPFLAGLLVAYAMNPAVRIFQKWGISRKVASSFMIISFFLLIALLLFIAIPFIQTELTVLASHVPEYGERIMTTLKPLLEDVFDYTYDAKRLRTFASANLGDVVSWGIKLLARILTNSLVIANVISLIVITPIVAFYCLRDWNLIINTIDHWLPRPYAPTIRRVFKDINETIGGFAKGQALVCLMIGTYYAIALTFAGLDFSIVVGVVIGVMAFIPYVGALVGLILSIGIALAQFTEWSSVGIVAAIFVVGQTMEAYLLIPYFVGNRIGLHPVWVLFALLAGGALYGFIGILFALPCAAAIGVLIRYTREFYFLSPYYLGYPPSLNQESREATDSPL
ncbi:MAG: AI-2E family transporter [Alphaproteobacteria bacterium]|nr:AI-2E family transporter [Alphaproteobacteria bacterium]